MSFSFASLYICFLLCVFPSAGYGADLVYAEMEFPLSFANLRQYSFNPLGRFQTQVEGRLIELTADPLVDIYQVTAGQQAYRPCLVQYKALKLRDRSILNFNIEKALWPDGRLLSFEDIWFSLEYRKLNEDSWGGNRSLIVTAKGEQTFDAYFGDNAWKTPKPGEFYFPVVNKNAFLNNNSPREAEVDKEKQKLIGYGRYTISDVEENRSITMKRRLQHPYYENLKLSGGVEAIDTVKMFAFPNARITRNEQFINGRVHLLTSTTQKDVSYITNTLGDNAKVSRYFDDSFSSFVFNCAHPYLEISAIRRAFNYLIRKELLLKRVLGEEGGRLISGPLPRRSFFYNLQVPVYQDDAKKALAMIELYRNWGLDLYEEKNEVRVFSNPTKGPADELAGEDRILEVERVKISSLEQFLEEIKSSKEDTVRVKIIREKRILTKRIRREVAPKVGIFSSVQILNGQLVGFPELNLIANNPEGKDPLIKQVCGAIKEDMKKIGIEVKIDYLDGKSYYPRLTQAKFDLAFRTIKMTGTPSIHRMFFHKKADKEISNTNYGRYSNESVNRIATSTRDVTEMKILISAWKKTHQVLHQDPPGIFLWSRQHILLHDPRLVVVEPDSDYKIPHGYTEINGLINIFNEVHLWGMKK